MPMPIRQSHALFLVNSPKKLKFSLFGLIVNKLMVYPSLSQFHSLPFHNFSLHFVHTPQPISAIMFENVWTLGECGHMAWLGFGLGSKIAGNFWRSTQHTG
jgi:hypothetical protein